MNLSPNSDAEACLSLHGKTQDRNQSVLEIFCPAVYDSLICWEPTIAGTIASRSCPTLKGSDSTYKAYRKCGIDGKWLNRDGISSDFGWTNYTTCLTPEIREIVKRLGSPIETQKKLDIAVNTRILEFVGLSLSLAALVLSLAIFHKFRTLRNSRTRIHRNLFVAMVIQVAIRLTLYIDQIVTRANTPKHYQPLSQENLQGIDNTPILCEAGYIFLEFARTAQFMWMFVEGLYLHNMITVTVFEEKLSPLMYSIVGWIIPIPLTTAWATVTALHYGSATCWWGYNFTINYWILEGPRIAVLIVNLAFLLNILRVLVTKLRRSNSSDIHQARKAALLLPLVKAALLLLPLLGLTNLVNMVHAPLEKKAWIFGMWSYSTHLLTSTQGFVLSCLYCFSNGEVQLALKKYFRSRILGRNKFASLPKNSVRMSLLNHSVVIIGGEEQIASTSGTNNGMSIQGSNLKKLTANQQEMILRHNQFNCTHNITTTTRNPANSLIQNSKKNSTFIRITSLPNEKINKVSRLQRLLSPSKDKSESSLNKDAISDIIEDQDGEDEKSNIETSSREVTIRHEFENETEVNHLQTSSV